jgi:hypothetical protein
LYSTPIAGAGSFRGGVLVPSGNVVLFGYQSPNVIVFNPLSYLYSNIPTNIGTNSFLHGGTLLPSGNVLAATNSGANIYVINPTTFTISNVGPTAVLGGGAVLLPNGNVFLCGASNCGLYNSSCVSSTGLGTNFSNLVIGTTSSLSAVLAQNGNVIALPFSGGLNVISYNTANFTYSNIPANASFTGGCLLPSGNIICAPTSAGNIGMVDPNALTYSNRPSYVGAMAGCTLLPSGQVLFTPTTQTSYSNVSILSTMVPAAREFCLSPFFNKF